MRLTLLPLENDGVLRVRGEGMITLGPRPAAADPLLGVLGPQRFTHRVVIDLATAQGIDTSGISWLMREHDAFRDAGGRLVLSAVPPVVRQMLDVLRLADLLDLAPDEAEARRLALEEIDDGAGPPAKDRPWPPRAV
jgi:anti-anti-sigma factor